MFNKTKIIAFLYDSIEYSLNSAMELHRYFKSIMAIVASETFMMLQFPVIILKASPCRGSKGAVK